MKAMVRSLYLLLSAGKPLGNFKWVCKESDLKKKVIMTINNNKNWYVGIDVERGPPTRGILQ